MSVLTSATAGKLAIALLAGGSLIVGAGLSAHASEFPALLPQSVSALTDTDEFTDDDLLKDDLVEEPVDEGDDESGEEGDGDSARGPDAAGPAAFGLCNAHSTGGLREHSTAFGALLAAASEGTVDEYCAALPAKVKSDDPEDGEGKEAEETEADGESNVTKAKKDKGAKPAHASQGKKSARG